MNQTTRNNLVNSSNGRSKTLLDNSKLKPFLDGRPIFIRLTILDGLFQQKTMAGLEKSLQEALKGKKLGSGMNFLESDLLRAVCLSTQLPVSGLISTCFLSLVKKSPNYRAIFEWLELAFRTIWQQSEHFRLQGMAMQVKGRYNISTDRSQRWNIRVGAVSLSNVDVLID